MKVGKDYQRIHNPSTRSRDMAEAVRKGYEIVRLLSDRCGPEGLHVAYQDMHGIVETQRRIDFERTYVEASGRITQMDQDFYLLGGRLLPVPLTATSMHTLVKVRILSSTDTLFSVEAL